MVKISKNKRELKASIKNEKKRQPDFLKNRLLLYAVAFAIASIILNLLLIPDKLTIRATSSSALVFLLIGAISSFTVFLGIYKQGNKEVYNFTRYSFLLYISLLILTSVFNTLDINLGTVKIYFDFAAVPIAQVGCLLVFLSREKVSSYIDQLYQSSENDNKGNSNNFKTFFSRKRIPSNLILITVLSIAAFTLFYKLEAFDLYSDEAQVTQGAAGYHYTSEFKQWSFIKEETSTKTYNRAWPHLYLIAKFYDIFGISVFSSRLPSVLFGLFFILITYLVVNHFTRDKIIAILCMLSFACFFNYLQLFRWARMYAVVIPLFLWGFYAGYRFFAEDNKLGFLKFAKQSGTGAYLNFNYAFLPLLIVLFYFLFHLHQNTLLLAIFLFILSIINFIYYRHKKYLFAFSSATVLGIIAFFLLPNVAGVTNFMSFFEQRNAAVYTNALLTYPFSFEINMVLLIIGGALFIVVKNKKFRSIYLYLFIIIIFSWILYSFMFDYPASFRYISFVPALSIMLLISIFVIVLKSIYPKAIVWGGCLAVLFAVAFHFKANYNKLYILNPLSPAYPSKAIKTIVKEHRPKDLIYRHWGPDFYYQGVSNSVILHDLGSYKGKPFTTIFKNLQQHPSGWLTWMSHNTWRMDSALVNYANMCFKKYHGHGIDNSGVEVFHYVDSMLIDSVLFAQTRFMPNANLNLANQLSIAFWIKINKNNRQSLFQLLQNNSVVAELAQTDENKLSVVYYPLERNSIITSELSSDNWYHICWYHEGSEANDEIAMFINGIKQAKGSLTNGISNLVKFKLNSHFVGEIDDIRIYNFLLDEVHINEIMRNRDNKNSAELIVNKKPFKTLFHWQKR